MAACRRTLVAVALLTAAVPATASAALTKVADPVNVAPDATAAMRQFYPDVAMAADGSFAVSYSEDDSPDEQVWVQRFSAGLAKVGERLPVGPAGQRSSQPAIAMAPDGRFAVAFQTYAVPPATPEHAIEVQRFAADGTPAGAPVAVDDANGDNDGEPPAIAMADDGRIAVAWIRFPASLRVRSFDAAGAPLTAAQELDPAAPSHARPSIGMAPDGRFMVTAQVNTTFGTAGGIYGWRFHSDGTPDGGRATLWTGEVNANYPQPTIGMGDDGSTFLAFDAPPTGSFESDVWGRRFDAAGTPLADRFGISDYTTYAQIGADVEVGHGGDALVAFEGQNGTQQWGYLRHFAADGTPDGIEDHISSSPSGGLQNVHVDSDGRARAAIAYSFSNQGAFNDVFVARWNFAAVSDPAPAPAVGGGGGQPASTPAPALASASSRTPTGPVSAAGPGKGSAALKVADVASFPSSTSCASRRVFAIRLRVPKGAGVTKATVKVNGKTVAVRKGARLRSTVDLRNLPKGRFTVSIVLTLSGGKTVKGERRYRTCTAKRHSAKPKV